MKRFITIYFFLSSFLLFSQDKVSGIYIGCYTDGDTLSKETINKNTRLTILNAGDRNASLKSWEMSFVQKDRKSKKNDILLPEPKSAAITPQMKEAMLLNYASGRGIIIQNIIISFTDKYTGETVEEEFLPVTFYFDENGFKNCDQKLTITANNVYYNGKLLTGKDKNLPVIDQKITLETTSDKELQSTVTNKNGNFTFTNLTANDSYKINVPIDAQSKIKDGQLYMAKQDGTIINSFNKTNTGFVYELLPEEISKITKEQEEDTELEIKKFSKANTTSNSSTTKTDYNGKLVTGKDKNLPVTDQKITLEASSNKSTQSTVTNKDGNFTFKDVSANDTYKINVPVDAQSKIKDGQLYMAKQDGTIIKSFNKTNTGFVYELLPEEINKMIKEKEEDTELEIKKFDQASKVECNGKLLTGKNKNVTVSDQKIILETSSNKEVQSTTTNDLGNFTFKNLSATDSYKITVPFDPKSKIQDGQLYMAKQDGTIIKSFNKTEKGFVYELLPNDPAILTKIKEEDPELKIKKINSTNNVEYLGKLMTGKDKKTPLSNQKIVLETSSGIAIQSIITSSYGNFTLKDLNINHSYKIIVLFDAQSKIIDGELYMAKLDGTIVKSFNKTKDGFEYELLPEEIK